MGTKHGSCPCPPHRGSLYILPSPSPPKSVWGRGAQEAGSPPPPFIQFSSPSSRLEPRWEESSSSLPPAGAFRLSVLKRSHSAWRPPALKRVALCSGRLPSAFPTACTLHSLKWAQSGWLAQRLGQGTSTVCLHSVTRDSLKWVRRGASLCNSQGQIFPIQAIMGRGGQARDTQGHCQGQGPHIVVFSLGKKKQTGCKQITFLGERMCGSPMPVYL